MTARGYSRGCGARGLHCMGGDSRALQGWGSSGKVDVDEGRQTGRRVCVGLTRG
jgi:hypothetical protein